MKVLIIDDSKVFHSYIKKLLKSNFSELHLFDSFSGEEGLKMYYEHRPDIILLDMIMPGIHGLHVLKEIRREDEEAQILVISRSEEEDMLEEAFLLGADDYIVKGPRPREMTARIRRAIQTREVLKAKREVTEELQREKKILEDVTFNSNCGLILMNREGEILYGNRIAKDWFGDLSGRTCYEIFDDPCSLKEVLEEKRASRKEYVLKNGRILYSNFSPVYGQRGEIEQITLVLLDITKRKRSEVSLQSAIQHIRAVNETFLAFGPDHDKNMMGLIETAGELAGADHAFYNEIYNNTLYIRKAWNPPPGLVREDEAQGHICDYVVKKGEVAPVLIQDLQNSSFAQTDPGVKALGLVTYLGCPVKVEGEVVGVLCALFRREIRPSESLLESMCTLARGLGVEVERKETFESICRFRNALDNSADAIFLIDYEIMKFIDVNQEACNSLGRTREELLTMGPHDIKPYYSEEALKGVFQDLIKEKEKNGVIQTTHERKDGSQFPVEVFIRYYKTESREYLIASVRDMTEHMEMKERIEESEERYRLLVENQIDAVCLWETDTTLLYVNDGYCQAFGKTQEELLGEKWVQLIPEDHRESILKHCQNLIEDPRILKYSHPITIADGVTRWFEWIDIPLKTEEGKVIKIQSVGRDITERIQAEKEIQKRIEFETLITSLSTYFINLPVKKIDEGILQGLRQICSFTLFDSAEIYLLSEDGKSASISHQWPREKNAIDDSNFMVEEELPLIMENLLRLETVSIPSVASLPEEMVMERFFFEEEGIESLILIPLSSGENLLGFLKLNQLTSQKTWCDDSIPLFKISGAMFVNALERKKAELNLQDELEKAKQIKNSLFPQLLPSFKDIEVNGIVRQASHVGGDYYNCFQIGDDLLFLMVDVTGHGLDAALITVFVSTFVRRELERLHKAPNPLAFLELLNNDFMQQGFPDDYFLEVFLGVLSLTTKEVQYAVAGSIRSLILHPCHPPQELPYSSGSLIHNFITKPSFGGGKTQLRPGEGLFIYTDGVDELLMTKDYQKGEGLMRHRVNSLYGLLKPEDLLEMAVDEALVLLKREKPLDDMSILSLTYTRDRQEREYTCPKDLGSVEGMIQTIQDAITEIQVDPDLVRMALHEALINAVLYSQRKGEVKVILAMDPYRLTIIVDDGGPGFSWRERLNTREEFLAPREGGRGLDLIIMATDTFAFNAKGNRISLGWNLFERE